MSDWKKAYSEILYSYVGMYKEARGNLELRNEILAEVKGKILEHEPLHSAELPHNLRVVRPLFIMLDRSENKEDAGCLVEEDSAEKQEVEISLDEDGNPENLARAVFQAAYAKFTKKPKAKAPWGLLIKSPMEYLDPESIPEGFMMKDPSKWTKADLRLLWDHWQSLEAEEKVIVSFIDCKKEDAPLSRQFDRKVVGSSKKRVWVTVDDDSEAEVGGAGIPGPSVTQHSVGGCKEGNTPMAPVL
ncbi:hypothetical protein F5141DRAFT_1211873 [Pisolithus sp. B1]|nr:hypothetical protein F5141DRAFT_1211873 [Pisolithus sp. B1]